MLGRLRSNGAQWYERKGKSKNDYTLSCSSRLEPSRGRHLTRELRMRAQERILAVHGQEVLRLGQAQHLLQLIPARRSALL